MKGSNKEPMPKYGYFDGSGNELATVSNGAAPDEEFSRDPYLEFTAEETGQYYVGVSQLGNLDYDPNVERKRKRLDFPRNRYFRRRIRTIC